MICPESRRNRILLAFLFRNSHPSYPMGSKQKTVQIPIRARITWASRAYHKDDDGTLHHRYAANPPLPQF